MKTELKEAILNITSMVLAFTTLACICTALYVTHTTSDYSKGTYFLALAMLCSIDVKFNKAK